MHECKTKLMQVLRAYVIDARVSTTKNIVDREAATKSTLAVARKELIGKDQKRESSNKPISPAEIAESVVARLPKSNDRPAVSTESPEFRGRSNRPSQSINIPEGHEVFQPSPLPSKVIKSSKRIV